MPLLKKSYSVAFLTVIFWACGGSGNEPSPADNTTDRQQILIHLADNVVIPSYENFSEVFDVMVARADEFTNAPGPETLVHFRQAWVDAYIKWQTVELFEFGPADKYTLRNFFNIYPTDVNGIITNMNDPAANLDVPAAYARQGFPALDYLLNGVAADEQGIVNAYTTDADAPKRIAYINRIIDRMSTLLSNVVTQWVGPYKDSFVNSTGLDIGSSMGTLVNAYVLYYERYIRTGKIGIPSGAAVGSTGLPYPEKVEGYYKRDISRDLAITAHETAANFFNGVNVITESDGPSFQSYLDALGAKDPSTNTSLSQIINDQFNTISLELNGLSPDLYQQIQVDNSAMGKTYTEMQKLVRLLKVDMTSAMSITITYTDNDGD